MRRFLVSLVAVLAAAAAGSSVHAEDKTYVTNSSNAKIAVYFTAAGCAGVVDKTAFVCGHDYVDVGDTIHYKYNAGTSARFVNVYLYACREDSHAAILEKKRPTGSGASTKHCAVTGDWPTKSDYDSSKYDKWCADPGSAELSC